MRSRKRKKIIIFLSLILCLMTLLLVYSIYSMRQDYFDSIGSRAMSFSQVTSDKLKLSNAEVYRLIGLDFNELLEDETNTAFEDYVRKFMQSTKIKYVYLLHNLDTVQVKYSVNQGEEELYGLPAGTDLNTIYLIDAVIDKETRLEDTDYQGYADKDRYTYLEEKIQLIYDKREADYVFYKDKWGSYISGFTPIYSIEGDYIGLLGADIFVDEYIQLLTRRIIFLSIFSLIILILINGLFKVYRKVFVIESEMDNLKSKAYQDEMTGLYNRSMLKEQQNRYNDLTENNINFAALMMDIDRFKSINDKYGHLIGDEIIISISDVIKSALKGNGWSFRYGGDEFTVLLENRELDQVQSIAKKIQKKVNEIKIEGVEEIISVSIGLAFKQINRKVDFKRLLKKADEMMYQSKKKGGNTTTVFRV